MKRIVPDIETGIMNLEADYVEPLVRGIYDMESSSGKAKTSRANTSGARGPMQVTLQTFKDLKARGYIPADYKWANPQHSLEAGIANIQYLADRYKTTDPTVIGAAYYGGPSAVNPDGTIKADRMDPKHPTFPTVGKYANKLSAYVKAKYPDYIKPPAPPPAPVEATPAAPPVPQDKSWWQKLFGANQQDITLPEDYSPGGRQKLI